MRYICLLYISEADLPAPGTPEFGPLRDANSAASAEMAKAGVLVDGAPLQPSRAATTVKIRGGETLLTDGPYAELKEQLNGYYLLECADLDEAVRWAQTIPAAKNGSVEVRPVVRVEGRP